VPIAVELQNLGSAHSTMTAIRNDVRLNRAPLLERRSPLLCTPKIEDLTAPFDYAAVNSACNPGRDFAGGHGYHRLVEQCHTAPDFSLSNQRAALALQRERNQVLVAKIISDLGGSHERRQAGCLLAFVNCAVTDRQKQIPIFNALGLIG
jgi:hypothetical protein